MSIGAWALAINLNTDDLVALFKSNAQGFYRLPPDGAQPHLTG